MWPVPTTQTFRGRSLMVSSWHSGSARSNAPAVRACLALGGRPGRGTDGRAHLPSSAERGVEIHSQALDDREVGGQLGLGTSGHGDANQHGVGMPVHHDVAHERDAKAVLVAEDAASDLMPVGDEQPAPLLLDDHGGEGDGTRACSVEGSGKRDGLDAVDGAPRVDAVHGGATDLVVLSYEEGDGDPDNLIAVVVGPAYGDLLARVDG